MTEQGVPAEQSSTGAPEPVPTDVTSAHASGNGLVPAAAAPDAEPAPPTGPVGLPVPGPRASDPERQRHYYGGQAVIEGVMMRGRDHWAIAVRQADGAMHTESHRVK